MICMFFRDEHDDEGNAMPPLEVSDTAVQSSGGEGEGWDRKEFDMIGSGQSIVGKRIVVPRIRHSVPSASDGVNGDREEV